MMEFLSAFHFVRPLWLLALIPAVPLVILARRADDAAARWRGVIAPELLRYLLVSDGKPARLTPNAVLMALWVIGAIAVAGPTWRRDPSPFAEARPPVMVVLKVTPSMMTEDLAPTRLDRARQKLSDLLSLREGAATGLVAYSGSSHLVLPPTPDSKVVLDLAMALAPDVIPKDGDDLAGAIALAQRILAGAGHGGSILVLADTVASDQIVQPGPGAANVAAILAISPPTVDATELAGAARALGATFITLTPDQKDVADVARRLDRVGLAASVAGEGDYWQEAGYWLTPLLALVVLLWFRRGWVLT